ncbi:hypothetical protein PoB_004363600 [Plakobranchus ocellatus]|uniref:Uncharacterized protein n=1 Tax=Plakobranchus ocellatus TaxID=259542 RepID=A0AAV4BEA8_9GAST|nr:hypothetical protein PoB_004363600 [Plakobranchus ocellatus]
MIMVMSGRRSGCKRTMRKDGTLQQDPASACDLIQPYLGMPDTGRLSLQTLPADMTSPIRAGPLRDCLLLNVRPCHGHCLEATDTGWTPLRSSKVTRSDILKKEVALCPPFPPCCHDFSQTSPDLENSRRVRTLSDRQDTVVNTGSISVCQGP